MESSTEHHDHDAHPRFSASRAFELNNPLRRLFDRSPQRIIKLLDIQPQWSLIDFGCGPGFYTIPFARVARRVVAADVQPEMLKKAEDYAKTSGVKVELVETDGTNIQLPPETFDLVFLNLVFHEIEDKRTVLGEFWKLLKPGGGVAIREKTENTLLPMGPPIIPETLIRSRLEENGFVEIHCVGSRRLRVVKGIKPRK